MTEFKISNVSELNQLLKGSFLWRRNIGMIVLAGEFESHPKRSDWQNELNTHYYACGCDESAGGFFLGVILGSLWVATAWFEGVTPSLLTILIGLLLAAAGGLIGKAVGKFIASQKLRQAINNLQLIRRDA